MNFRLPEVLGRWWILESRWAVAALILGVVCVSGIRAQVPADSLENHARIIYETSLMQVEFYLKNRPTVDSLMYDLIGDARDLAQQGDFQNANFLINTLLELLADSLQNGETTAADSNPVFNSPNRAETLTGANDFPGRNLTNFQIEAGVDYSNQEFEMTFLESDSLVTEELQNPYLAFLIYHPIRMANLNLELDHRLRVDNQFLSYDVSFLSEKRVNSFLYRYELQNTFFYSQSAIYPHFLDTQFRLTLGKSFNYPSRWFFILKTRYKWLPRPDSLNNDIVSASAGAYFEHNFNFRSQISLNLIPEFYQERRALGQTYFQFRGEAAYRYRQSFRQYVELQAGLARKNFKNVLDSDAYKNRYWRFNPLIKAEFALGNLGLQTEVEAEYYRYQNPNEINPNLWHYSVDVVPKYFWKELHSLGIGVRYEKETHHTPDLNTDLFVSQEDYVAKGVVLTSDVIDFSGTIVNLEYSITWRDYLNSQNRTFFSYYSDRLVHSIQVFAWVPIFKRWQIQVLANYDSDHDREIRNNDNRNTIINMGLIYKF